MNSDDALCSTPRSRRGRWLALLVALFLAAPVSGLAWAAGTGIWWTRAANLSNRQGRSIHHTVARDPGSGDLFVAWSDDGVAEKEEIMVRRWDASSQRWRPAENLSQSEAWQRNGGPAVVFDDQGHGILAWTQTYAASQGATADGHDLLWRGWDGTAWSAEQVLFHGLSYIPGAPGAFGLIPVNTPDALLLFVIDGKGYRIAKFQGGVLAELSAWDYTALDVNLVQIIVDDDGLYHASAFGRNSTEWGDNKWFQDAYYVTYDGENWSKETNLSFIDGVANSIGMAFDGQGRLHFLWSDPWYRESLESFQSTIWERIYEGGTWTNNTKIMTDSLTLAINSISLAADASGTLHLAWSEGSMVDYAHTDLDIMHRQGDGTTWGPATQVYTSTAQSRYPISGIEDGSAFVLWQEQYQAGGPLLEHEVYFSRQTTVKPPDHLVHFPIVSK